MTYSPEMAIFSKSKLPLPSPSGSGAVQKILTAQVRRLRGKDAL
jgi:hypothetical protein